MSISAMKEEKLVRTNDISKEPVDETAKYRHISYVCPNCYWSLNRHRVDWVGLTPTEFNRIKDTATTIGYAITKTEAMLKEKNAS